MCSDWHMDSIMLAAGLRVDGGGEAEKQRGQLRGLGQDASGRGGEKWPGSYYTLKVELTGCAEGQHGGRRGREDSG